jgi:hypothetical protein
MNSMGDVMNNKLGRNNNAVQPGRFVTEPPTLISLGFEWYIEGDDNHNAGVNVWFRKKGEDGWEKALPLLRIQNEESIIQFLSNGIDYVTPNLFAGSIFDLEPNTEYECKFQMFDPDGVHGESEKIVVVRTRPEPKPFAGGAVYHVYPREYAGPKAEPCFVNLMYAYYTGWCTADWWNVAPPRVQPGDTILIHAGVYKEDWNFYGADIWDQGMGTPFQGTYYLTAKGTSEKPIVIKAAGDGEVIFDGNNNFNLFNLLAADHHYFEGITFRNTYVALLAGNKNIAGSVGLTVKRCRFEDIDKGIHTDWSGSKEFYIADNTFIGRNNPESLHGWLKDPIPSRMPPPHYPYEKCLSEYAIKIAGAGHVICHNYVANFHDGIDHATYGVPDGYPPYAHPDEYPLEEVLARDRVFVSIDIHNNFIVNMHDNFIEADGAMYNIRVFRNLCISGAAHALSSQTLFGGPAYFIRNIVYHAPNSIKHAQNPSGMVYYHNTLTARVLAAQASNYHFRNNLILGWWPSETLFSVDTFTNYTSSDYNGFSPDPQAADSFVWKSPPFRELKNYTDQRIKRKFGSLKEYSQATGQDQNSVLVDYDIFVNVGKPDTEDFARIYDAKELDFRLKPDAVAVDAGCVLPNINEEYTGKAPDLGALEVGEPDPVYGPRT